MRAGDFVRVEALEGSAYPARRSSGRGGQGSLRPGGVHGIAPPSIASWGRPIHQAMDMRLDPSAKPGALFPYQANPGVATIAIKNNSLRAFAKLRRATSWYSPPSLPSSPQRLPWASSTTARASPSRSVPGNSQAFGCWDSAAGEVSSFLLGELAVEVAVGILARPLARLRARVVSDRCDAQRYVSHSGDYCAKDLCHRDYGDPGLGTVECADREAPNRCSGSG